MDPDAPALDPPAGHHVTASYAVAGGGVSSACQLMIHVHTYIPRSLSAVIQPTTHCHPCILRRSTRGPASRISIHVQVFTARAHRVGAAPVICQHPTNRIVNAVSHTPTPFLSCILVFLLISTDSAGSRWVPRRLLSLHLTPQAQLPASLAPPHTLSVRPLPTVDANAGRSSSRRKLPFIAQHPSLLAARSHTNKPLLYLSPAPPAAWAPSVAMIA